jgi:hypothetical protein
MDLPEGTTATVINGQNAQSQTASATNPLLAWQIGNKKLENFPVFLLSRWLSSVDIKPSFAGLETIDGTALNHISIVDYSQRIRPLNPWKRDGHRGEYVLYVDPATSLPARLHYYQETDDTYFLSLAPIDVVYSDFSSAGSLVFPTTLTRYFGKEKVDVLQLQFIQPNGTVSDQNFQIR